MYCNLKIVAVLGEEDYFCEILSTHIWIIENNSKTGFRLKWEKSIIFCEIKE
jgi:hypothetical protein